MSRWRRTTAPWAWAVAALLVLDTVAVVSHPSRTARRPFVAVGAGQAEGNNTTPSGPPETVLPSTTLPTKPANAPAATLAPRPTPAPAARRAIPRPASGARTSPGTPAAAPPQTITAAASFQLASLAGLHFASASVGWISGQQDGKAFIVATRDSGASWQAQCIPVGPGTIWQVTAVDPDHVWAFGSDLSRGTAVALWSTDGGGHWTAGAVPPGIATLVSAAFVDAEHGWAVGTLPGGTNGADGVIVHTDDGGRSWTTQPLPAQAAAVLYGVSFADALHGWAAGTALDHTGVVLATADGGSTWTSQQLPPGVGELHGIDFTNATQGWAVGWDSAGGAPSAGVILATGDGGATWARQAHDPDTATWATSFSDASDGWVVGQRQDGQGEMLATRDAGATWQRQAAPAPTVVEKASFADAADGWAGGQQIAVLRTGDGGANWLPIQVVTSGPPCG